jgi:hypothetical protein
MNKFSFLKAFNSPFIRPKIKFYFGKLQFGTPYFYPRRWIKNPDKPGYLKAVTKNIGFDFVGLGWKTKWEDTDYRFEWAPMWSFVFFKWQACIFFEVPHPDNYWTSWLYYERNTDKSKSQKERIEKTIEEFPQVWTNYDSKGEYKINYYDLIL